MPRADGGARYGKQGGLLGARWDQRLRVGVNRAFPRPTRARPLRSAVGIGMPVAARCANRPSRQARLARRSEPRRRRHLSALSREGPARRVRGNRPVEAGGGSRGELGEGSCLWPAAPRPRCGWQCRQNTPAGEEEEGGGEQGTKFDGCRTSRRRRHERLCEEPSSAHAPPGVRHFAIRPPLFLRALRAKVSGPQWGGVQSRLERAARSGPKRVHEPGSDSVRGLALACAGPVVPGRRLRGDRALAFVFVPAWSRCRPGWRGFLRRGA